MYQFNYEKQHFINTGNELEIPENPLTVTLQINRTCNLKCVYCSEYGQIDDISMKNAEEYVSRLKGVKRVIISGGEPLMHRNVLEILKLCRENFDVVALATNATLITRQKAEVIVPYVDYFDITIDGPRNIHNCIRGAYDNIIEGIQNIRNAGGKLSIVTVLFEKNKDVLPYIALLADTFEAEKLKILSPIPKGKGVDIYDKRLTSEETEKIFRRLVEYKDKFGLRTKLVMTDWNRIREGHAILIHPDGTVVASPVWTQKSCVEIIGDLNGADIHNIWENYPYKEHHVSKYIEKTMRVYA
jgi:MoaA/NifB/PqqE/SkfB family radical SAM enzyme